MNKNYIFGIGIALVAMLVFTAPAMAGPNTGYFIPQTITIDPGETTYVEVWVNITDPIGVSEDYTFDACDVNVTFDSTIADITATNRVPGDPWDSYYEKHRYGDSWWFIMGAGNWSQYPYGQGPGLWPVVNFTIMGVSPGTMDLAFSIDLPRRCNMFDALGDQYPNKTWVDGTITCAAQAYTISGYTNPAADTVNITNMDESKGVDDRPANYIDPVTGFYNLTLNVPDEIDTGDVLRIIACDVPDNYTSNCNVTDHTVVDISGETVNLTLNHYCQNYYPSFPFHTWAESDWSGPAAMEMLIDNYRDTSDVPNQTVLNTTGLSYNQACNADILFVDPLGMKSTLNQYLHAYEGLPYVANYGIGSYDTIEKVLHYICKWQYLGPGAAPAYGNYSNWMVIRGIHTNKTPSFTQGSYEIYGFWINDPFNTSLEGPGGIGENTYKSVDQWSSIYHKKLNESGVNTSDNYYDLYVAVCEPPEDDDVVLTLAHAKPRFDKAITVKLTAEPMMLYGAEQLALEKVVRDDEKRKIVKAAIDGVTEELVPYDDEFAAVFAKTNLGKPMLVTGDSGDYYIVPFNAPMKGRLPVEVMPIEIKKPNGIKKLGRWKRMADKIEFKPIPIEPIRLEKTLVVVIVDAEDGSFKEASWVDDPVKYLPVSKRKAVKLALSEIDITSARELKRELRSWPTIELVYAGESPYYPDWKITVGGTVFYVSQDGTVNA